MDLRIGEDKAIMQQEALALQIELHIEKIMVKKLITPVKLSLLLGKKRSYIDQLDYGKLTVRQLSDIFTALDSTLTINTIDGLVFHTSLGKD